jgi:hypothetical protein
MMAPTLILKPLQADVCQVLDAKGLHMGNLKMIGAVWKFKAIGYGPAGELIPGGGPLTGRHNTRFDSLDAAVISATLLL